jgi:hypothetical protein
MTTAHQLLNPLVLASRFEAEAFWKQKHGGTVEIWGKQIASAKMLVLAANRPVAIETSETSWHSLGTVMANRALFLRTMS